MSRTLADQEEFASRRKGCLPRNAKAECLRAPFAMGMGGLSCLFLQDREETCRELRKSWCGVVWWGARGLGEGSRLRKESGREGREREREIPIWREGARPPMS